MFYVVGIIAFMAKGMTGTVLNVIMSLLRGQVLPLFLVWGRQFLPLTKFPFPIVLYLGLELLDPSFFQAVSMSLAVGAVQVLCKQPC